MQNLNQQNSQLDICIPQLNALGHPSDFWFKRYHTGNDPQALPGRGQVVAWPPGQNCYANRCFMGFLNLILKQNTEEHRGQCGKGDPVWVQGPWALLSVDFPTSVHPDTVQAGPHHTRTGLWRKHRNMAFGNETHRKANPCSGVLQVFNWCSLLHVCLTVLRMPGKKTTIPHLTVAF